MIQVLLKTTYVVDLENDTLPLSKCLYIDLNRTRVEASRLICVRLERVQTS